MDLGELEPLGEGLQSRLGIRRAGEALATEALEGFQIGLALFRVLPTQGRLGAELGRPAVNYQSALPDASLHHADGAMDRVSFACSQVLRHRIEKPLGGPKDFRNPADPAAIAQFP